LERRAVLHVIVGAKSCEKWNYNMLDKDVRLSVRLSETER